VNWGPVIAGVDASSESAVAATVAWRIAHAAETRCYIVHAAASIADVAAAFAPELVPLDELKRELRNHARQSVETALRDRVPPELLNESQVEVWDGKGVWTLREAIRRHDAGLLVLGGKHHSAIGRWLGGSTAHNAVRLIDVPVLITASLPESFDRVLVGVDLSHAAVPTLCMADRFAALFDARVRVVHVIEPFPLRQDHHSPFTRSHLRESEVYLAGLVSEVDGQWTEPVVRWGHVDEVLSEESTEWGADVLVVGSHGHGWVHRALLGSTTERLLSHMPTSLVVMPVNEPRLRS